MGRRRLRAIARMKKGIEHGSTLGVSWHAFQGAFRVCRQVQRSSSRPSPSSTFYLLRSSKLFSELPEKSAFPDLPEKSACTLPKKCCTPCAVSPRSVALPSPKHNCLGQFEQQRSSTLQEKQENKHNSSRTVQFYA